MGVSNSRKLIKALRHDPIGILGVNTDIYGYVDVDVVLEKLNISMLDLQTIHDTNEKRRFQFNSDKTKIRATQGHTIPIIFDLTPIKPPKILYHRTYQNFVEDIKNIGLKKMNRHHVHLTESIFLNKLKPIILEVDSERMYKDGFEFIKTTNDVWLVDHVPIEYLREVKIETKITIKKDG